MKSNVSLHASWLGCIQILYVKLNLHFTCFMNQTIFQSVYLYSIEIRYLLSQVHFRLTRQVRQSDHLHTKHYLHPNCNLYYDKGTISSHSWLWHISYMNNKCESLNASYWKKNPSQPCLNLFFYRHTVCKYISNVSVTT